MYPHIDAEPDPEPGAEQTEFTFDELDDRAKERARDRWRELDMQDQWWDAVYEDAVEIGALLGIEIGNRSFRAVGGKNLYEPDIYFCLHVQGSGACYSGQLVVEKLQGARARLVGHVGEHGQDTLFELAAQAEDLYNLILVRALTRRLLGLAPDDTSTTYVHDEIGTSDVLTIEGRDEYYRTGLIDDNQYPDELAKAVDDYVDAFAGWIHDGLEAESMYRYSAEYVDENIRSNDCLFDEFGSII